MIQTQIQHSLYYTVQQKQINTYKPDRDLM